MSENRSAPTQSEGWRETVEAFCRRAVDSLDKHGIDGEEGRFAEILIWDEEVIAILDTLAQPKRPSVEADLRQALHRANGETAELADEVAYWRYQAIWHRCQWSGIDPDEDVNSRAAERDLEEGRIAEKLQRAVRPALFPPNNEPSP